MKTLVFILILAMGLAGCGLPAEVKNPIYVATATLAVTVQEARAATTQPWAIPPNETQAQKIARLQMQVDKLILVADKCSIALKAVTDYLEATKDTPTSQPAVK